MRSDLLLVWHLAHPLIAELGAMKLDDPYDTAREQLTVRFEATLAGLQATDYREALAALIEVSESEPGGDRALKLASVVQEFTDDYREANDLFCTLLALAGLVSRQAHGELRGVLAQYPWSVQHEVLTRWYWMQWHEKLVNEGEEVEWPFHCRVGSRGSRQRSRDREFYQLLLFLHGLKMTAGVELLVLARGETPDFLLETALGGTIGAEMTEVPVSRPWSKAKVAEERFFKAVRPMLQDAAALLSIRPAGNPSRVWRHAEELRNRVSVLVARCVSQNREVDAAYPDLGIERLRVKPSSPLAGTIWLSDGSDPADRIRELARSLQRAVADKISRRGRGRPKPSVRPCMLVLYPNHDLDWEDADDALTRVRREGLPATGSHFDEVWLCQEAGVTRLG